MGTEYKDEIVMLVRDVLPGEIDGVDDMLTQFAGREESLRGSLFLMKQRQEEEEHSILSMIEEEGSRRDSPTSAADLVQISFE